MDVWLDVGEHGEYSFYLSRNLKDLLGRRHSLG
jgi:hypothetical protein